MARRVIVATGGSPKQSGLDWLARLGLPVVEPVPSLFTFNLPTSALRQLAGIAVPGIVRLPLQRRSEQGPVLLTHWGLSGPAVLRLSAFAARELATVQYRTPVQVDWTAGADATAHLQQQRQTHGRRQLGSGNPWQLPARLWQHLLHTAGIAAEATWAALPKAQADTLIRTLQQHELHLEGKTTYKDEFVTAGGVDRAAVDFRTMEARRLPGLHLAGEVLDVDGVTGGFNFQAAWTTGWLAGRAAASCSR